MTAEPLNTLQINNVLRQTVPCFKGVYSSDQLPEDTEDEPWCIVINSDCSHRGGTHWVAFYVDAEGYGHYFDSFGRMPVKVKWIEYLRKKSRNGLWEMQRRVIQGPFSPFCGYYVMLFLLLRHVTPLDISDYNLMLPYNDKNIIPELVKQLGHIGKYLLYK